MVCPGGDPGQPAKGEWRKDRTRDQKCFTNEGHPRHTEQTPIETPNRNKSADFKILVGLKTAEMGCQKVLLLDCLKPLFVLPPRTAPAHLTESLPVKLEINDNLGYGLSAYILSR